ncbi:MAG: hypothetical protein HY586_04440, partial [Candidatus Omnitrophica bacterium]|nr:hypothetical protein [Candidatus Omnitrophota bacterium]
IYDKYENIFLDYEVNESLKGHQYDEELKLYYVVDQGGDQLPFRLYLEPAPSGFVGQRYVARGFSGDEKSETLARLFNDVQDAFVMHSKHHGKKESDRRYLGYRLGVNHAVQAANLVFRDKTFYRIRTGVGKTTSIFNMASVMHAMMSLAPEVETEDFARATSQQQTAAKARELLGRVPGYHFVFILPNSVLFDQTVNSPELKSIYEALGIHPEIFNEDILNEVRAGDPKKVKERLDGLRRAPVILAEGKAVDFLGLRPGPIEKKDDETEAAFQKRKAQEEESQKNVEELFNIMYKNNRAVLDEADTSPFEPGVQSAGQAGDEALREEHQKRSGLVDRAIGEMETGIDIVDETTGERRKKKVKELDGIARLAFERNLLVLRVWDYEDEERTRKEVTEKTWAEYEAGGRRGVILDARINLESAEFQNTKTGLIAQLQELAREQGIRLDPDMLRAKDEQAEALHEDVKQIRASLVGRAKALKQFEGRDIGVYFDIRVRELSETEADNETLARRAKELSNKLQSIGEKNKEHLRRLARALAPEAREQLAKASAANKNKTLEKISPYLHGQLKDDENWKNLLKTDILNDLDLIVVEIPEIKVMAGNAIAPRLQQSDPYVSAHTQLVFLRYFGTQAGLDAIQEQLATEEGIDQKLKDVKVSNETIRSSRSATIGYFLSGGSDVSGFSGTLAYLVSTLRATYG